MMFDSEKIEDLRKRVEIIEERLRIPKPDYSKHNQEVIDKLLKFAYEQYQRAVGIGRKEYIRQYYMNMFGITWMDYVRNKESASN